MLCFNEMLSRQQTFVMWTNATHLVLNETLSDSTSRTTTLNILDDFPEITESHPSAIGAARWSTDQQRVKSQDGIDPFGPYRGEH